MATLTQRFGNRIRKIREHKRISQMELAARSGLDLTTVNELENGNREPLLRTIGKIANALEVSLTQLFDF